LLGRRPFIAEELPADQATPNSIVDRRSLDYYRACPRPPRGSQAAPRRVRGRFDNDEKPVLSKIPGRRARRSIERLFHRRLRFSRRGGKLATVSRPERLRDFTRLTRPGRMERKRRAALEKRDSRFRELFTRGLGKSALCSVRLRGREGTMAPMPGCLGRKDPLDSIAPGLESSDQSQEHTRILDSGNGRTASLRGILGWNSGGAVGL